MIFSRSRDGGGVADVEGERRGAAIGVQKALLKTATIIAITTMDVMMVKVMMMMVKLMMMMMMVMMVRVIAKMMLM